MNFIRKNTGTISLIVVYLFTVLMQTGSSLLLAISPLFDNNLVELSFANLVTGLTTTAIVGVALFWREIVAGFDYSKEETLWRILSVFLWVGLIFLVGIVIQKIVNNDPATNQQGVLSFSTQVPLLVTLFSLAVMRSIAGEPVFRQVLMNCLSETIGVISATIVSIFLFTFMHTQQLLDFLIHLPGAILLSATYLESNRPLVFVMATRIVNNMLGFLL